jgi:hypothetical protein
MIFLKALSISLFGRFNLSNLIVLLLSTTPVILKGQSENSLERYLHSNTSYPAEKIYLHLDRPGYLQGDTIWFKAYTWFGFDQIPDSVSKVLYVELLNPLGTVEQKRKLLIENGASHGEFSLGKTITPGKYTLRAYTRWMQNMNTGEPFYQSITINPIIQNFQVECTPVIIKQAGNDSLKVSFRFFEMNERGELSSTDNHKINYSLISGNEMLHSGTVQALNSKEEVFKCSLSAFKGKDSVATFVLSIKDDRMTFEKQFRIPLNEPIDIQFFPEGGNLIEGIRSKIAFKAIGTDGLSRDVSGVIKDDSEVVITGFNSYHKGMGAFTLKPEAGKKYFAHVFYNQRLYIIPLPESLKNGSVMSVDSSFEDNNLLVTIKQTHSDVESQKYMTGSAYGKIRFAFPFNISDSCLLKIPLDLFPEGVSSLTVLNEEFKPECERLVYIDKDQRFKIEITPDSSSYGTRSKVTLAIKTTKQNGEPVQADLSLTVVDKEQLTQNEEVIGISAYKLLQSELKGYIEDADYYFPQDSSTNHSSLDLLMLTQGYRKFLSAGKDAPTQKFQPERNFEVSGQVKLPGKGKRVKNYNYDNISLTLVCRSDGVYLNQLKSDSLGHFKFQIPLLLGKSNSLIQATTLKGKPFYGEVMLDDTAAPPQFELPTLTSNKLTIPAVEYMRQLQAVKKTELSKSPWDTSMSISLGEVTVTAKAKNWYRDFESEAEKIADLDSLDPTGKKYNNIYELLIEKFGARSVFLSGHNIKTIILPCVSIGPDYWFPIYVINGKTYFNAAERGDMFSGMLNYISALRVNEVKTLMVLPPGDISSYYADPNLLSGIRQSLVVIETYSSNTFRGDPVGIKTFILEGLDAPRVFYSPSYEGPNKKSPGYDGRKTLFWSPSINTFVDGQAKIDFYTGDRKMTMEVFVNGIEYGNGNTGQTRALIGK